MSTYRLKDFVDPIAITVQDPANSGFERFVGLEHYDSNELVIKRFSGVELLTTNAKAFQKNDLLIARRNVYLRRAGVVYFDGITSGDSIVLRVKEDCEKQTGISRELAQRVLPLVLNTDRFWIYANKHADGMNSKRISKDTLLDYEFNLPSIEEQKVLADKLWAAYKVKESYRQLLSTTDEMLKAKFQEMFGDGRTNPNNWEETKISKCFPYIKNGVNIKQIEGASGIPITRIETLAGGVFNRDRLGYANVHSIDGYEKYVLTTGDLLMSHINSKAYIGRTVEYVKKGEEVIIHGMNLLCLKADEKKVLPSYYVHYTHSRTFLEDIAKIRKDAINQSSINTTDFGNIPIILPPLFLQQQFAEIATQAEATKASLRASIEAIDRVIRSLINQ